MTDAAFCSLWNPLLDYAARWGIDRDSAKDLVMDAIVKVMQQFDPQRGEMLHFAYRVLGNGIKNHFRSTNKTGGLTVDFEDGQPTPHDAAVMKEEARRAAELLMLLRSRLDQTEIGLLTILQEQMETDQKYNVSEAARALGIEPLKAHDIMRKIQRKLFSMRPKLHITEKVEKMYNVRPSEAPVEDAVSEAMLTSGEEEPSSVVRSSLFIFRSIEECGEYEFLLAETRDLGVFVRISEKFKNLSA